MKVLLLLGATILIWGIVWRTLAKFWRGKGHGGFTSHLGAGIVGFVVSMMFFGTLAPKEEPAGEASASGSAAAASSATRDVSASSSSTEQRASLPVVATAVEAASSSSGSKDEKENNANEDREFGMTPKQYAARFDEIVKTMDLPFRARFSNKHRGRVVDTVRADFDERMGLIARVSKESGRLLEVTFIAGSDGTPDTAANIVLVAAAALTAAIPDVSVKSVAPKIMDMVTKYKEGGDNQERVLNGVKLYYLRGEGIGHWFGAKPT
ncbi:MULTISPECIES: hypothetical protein [pseudomallei group]|uniref:hypothetical protein n=1 Tax=pseudomallei group TaxID=111527 RepID=UPI001E5D8D33|nr:MULTISPECIES: hypothetical protein [pseudomallei group]MCS3399910.1 hypothetical protein [Burkholderia thailandensis]MCS6428830.1 hypothetical protein [Burkholderia thailandensis]MCS6451545.1 hypothetical protein [Burkholderia thailandensis]MCS6467857.1 hypothetical protein [Burkholderia thailandensis]MCS6484185.1 hypothetical protein [Burkholderia thailandensis]